MKNVSYMVIGKYEQKNQGEIVVESHSTQQR